MLLWKMLACVLLVSSLLAPSYCQWPMVVSLPDGDISGAVMTSHNKHPFWAFQGRQSQCDGKRQSSGNDPGIPYAEPPLGDLRWAPPVPSAGWSGVLDGGQPHMMCVQVLASWHIMSPTITLPGLP